MPITHSFISAKSDGVDPTEVQPSHWNAAHVGSAGNWEQELEKSSDQTVSASTTVVDAAGLSFSVTTGSYWRLEAELLYSGTDATGDFKSLIVVSAGNMTGWYRFVGSDTTTDSINVSTGIRIAASTTTSTITAGTDATNAVRVILIEAMFRFSADATLKIQFAQNSAAGATTLKAGSTLRGRRMI